MLHHIAHLRPAANIDPGHRRSSADQPRPRPPALFREERVLCAVSVQQQRFRRHPSRMTIVQSLRTNPAAMPGCVEAQVCVSHSRQTHLGAQRPHHVCGIPREEIWLLPWHEPTTTNVGVSNTPKFIPHPRGHACYGLSADELDKTTRAQIKFPGTSCALSECFPMPPL